MARGPIWRRSWAGALVALAALTVAPAALAAPTFKVTTTSDSTAACTASACSLRAAIAAANATTGATVVLPSSSTAQTYQLTAADGGELDITAPMTLRGAGSTISVIHGDGAHRVLEINTPGTVAISGVEITGGAVVSGTVAQGGGIRIDQGTVTLDGVRVDHNTVTGSPGATSGHGTSAFGGGIYASNATLTIAENSEIDDNTVTAGAGGRGPLISGNGGAGGYALGGGVYSVSGTSLTVTGSTISANVITGGVGGFATAGNTPGLGGGAYGGGIDNVSTTPATISASTVAGNHAVAGAGGSSSQTGTGGQAGAGLGGGIYAPSALSLNGDTISGNSATGGAGGGGGSHGEAVYGDGGGVYLNAGATIDASTLSHNTATGGAPNADGNGGGIFTAPSITAPIVVLNSTLFDNTAQNGGGVFAYSSLLLASDTLDANQAPGSYGGNVYANAPAIVTAESTIVADGVAVAGKENCVGTVHDPTPGDNLETDVGPTGQCGFTSAHGDKVGVDPMLDAALAFHGGPTLTLALAPNSPARGAGGACVDPTKTGNPRLTVDQRGAPRGAVCDIGAFQTQAPLNTKLPAITGTPAVAGAKLVCGQGTWFGDGTLTFARQWLRDGAPIPGARNPTYTVASKDAGHQLSCKVTATSGYGTMNATSAAVTATKPTPPAVSNVSQSAKIWRPANRAAHITAKHPPTGTTFKFTLNEPAAVSFAFTQAVTGRRIKHKCVAQTKHNRHAPSCTLRTLTRATLTFTGHAGTNTVKFYGRLSKHHKLSLGTYTLVITATASRKTSKPRRLTFTIVG